MPPVAESVAEIAGLRTIVVQKSEPAGVIVMLHGYAMTAENLAPFTHSLRADMLYLLPQAPHRALPSGRAWWPIDVERRECALQSGARDLADELPPGREAARQLLREFLASVTRQHPGSPLILAGFSQGAMLACDTLLFDRPAVSGLALMSASRIAMVDWRPRLTGLAGLRVFISHGRNDHDLSFFAGEQLRDCLQDAEADVTWVPFEGGHEIPLVVWREFRRFVAKVLTSRA